MLGRLLAWIIIAAIIARLQNSNAANVTMKIVKFVDIRIQTHKRFKERLFYYDLDTQSADFRGNPFRQATKRHFSNT